MPFFKRKKYPIGTELFVPFSMNKKLGYGIVIDVDTDIFGPYGGTDANPQYLVQFEHESLWIGQDEMEKFSI